MAGPAFFNSRSTARMHYSYPTLERKEILKCLSQMGVTGLAEENLMKPTAEVIWPLYENLVQYLVDVPREEIQQPVLGALDCLRNEELYDEAVATLASYRFISKLMYAAGVVDFGTKDIFRPEPSRTVHFLSAIINFAMFREERELEDVQEERDKLVEKIQLLEERRQQLESAITEKEAERKSEEPQVERLELETKELEQVISNLNKQQALLQSDIRSIKQELNNLTEKIASEKSLLAQMKQEGFQLRTQIVQSPDKLQKMLEDKKLAFQNAEADRGSARQSVVKWKNKLDSYTKAKKKVQKSQDMMDALEKQITLQKKVAKDLKEMKMKLKTNEEQDWAVNAQLEELKIEGQHFQELLEKVDTTAGSKRQEADKELEDFKIHSAPFRVEQEGLKKEIAKKEAQAKMIKSKIAELYLKKEAGLKALYDEVELLQNEVLLYNNDLMAAIDSAPDFYNIERGSIVT